MDVVRVGVDALYKLVKGPEIQAEVEIVHEGLFLIPDVNEGGIQCREQFLDFSEEHVPDIETGALAGLTVKFDKPVILHQGYRNLA